MIPGGDWGGVNGRRVVITGATNGIGLAAATELASRGAHLAIVGRDAQRVTHAQELVSAPVVGIEFAACDRPSDIRHPGAPLEHDRVEL